jgi:hypothetical protein
VPHPRLHGLDVGTGCDQQRRLIQVDAAADELAAL